MNKYQTNRGILFEDYADFPESPRDHDEGIFTKFYTFLRSSSSPDKCEYTQFKVWMESFLSVPQFKVLDVSFRDKGFNAQTCGELVHFAFKRGYILLPVWKYEHSGVVYRTGIGNPFSDKFDSCMAGVIYCSKEDVYKIFGKRCTKGMVLKINQIMQNEVEEYSFYANGECYEYLLTDCDGEEDEQESGWYCGYYGDIDVNGVKDDLGITECTFLEEL